jgi:Fic family protein
VNVHPYRDGNGRLARFLMNYVLGAAGVPWITIRIDDRERYFSALETAQCDGNFGPFTEFMKRSFEEL